MPDNTDKWLEFEMALKNHDWFFEWSDDHSMYMRGVAEANHIKRLRASLNRVNPERVLSMWNELAPKEFKLGEVACAAS